MGFDVDPADLDHNTDGLLDQLRKIGGSKKKHTFFVKGDVV